MHAFSLFKFYCRSPEFFYPRKFITVKSAAAHLDTSVVSTICHGTHLNEVEEICASPNTATFVGNNKKWRPGIVYSKEEDTYNSPYCSHIVENIAEEPKPMRKDTQWSFGPFVWFGTSRKEVDDYGPYCFEFQLKNVLQNYHKSRGKEKSLCYRAGGTLVYKQEVTHIVIICCEDDKEYQSYPLIEATSTKYFKPPIKFIRSKIESAEPPVHKKQKFDQQCSSSKDAGTQSYYVTEDGTLSYQTLPSEEFSIPAMALRSADLDGERHEHVALAFYLPDGITLQLTNQDGILVQAAHVGRCMKTKGKGKRCQFTQFDTHYLDAFNGSSN